MFLLLSFSLAAEPCDPSDPGACPAGQYCVEVKSGVFKCVRALEIVYPNIPGTTIPETVATGLPAYVNYLFRLSIIIIGFVILGVLVYSGVRYLTSTGDPAKMSDAREGIFSAFLGTVILLSAYLIFNTINPQLTILNLAEVEPLGQIVDAGVYLCNYTIPNIEELLENYITEPPGDKQVEAAKALRDIIYKEGRREKCEFVYGSGNIEDFTFEVGYTIFAVPSLHYERDADGNIIVKPSYEFGVVLHEKYNSKGGCVVYTGLDENGFIYGENNQLQYYATTPEAAAKTWGAKSVTLFRKPMKEIPADATAVTLYSCYDGWSDTAMCPVSYPVVVAAYFKPDIDINYWQEDDIHGPTYPDNPHDTLVENSRSATVDPKGGYFGLVFDAGDFTGNCGTINQNSPDLSKLPIDKGGEYCKTRLWFYGLFTGVERECIPKIHSLIVIKGQIIGR